MKLFCCGFFTHLLNLKQQFEIDKNFTNSLNTILFNCKSYA